MCEICSGWARTGEKIIGGKVLPTNHHPNCPHYFDSIMDVWKVTLDGSSCYVDNERDAIDTAGDEEPKPEIIKTKMHREVFENLPEFGGF